MTAVCAVYCSGVGKVCRVPEGQPQYWLQPFIHLRLVCFMLGHHSQQGRGIMLDPFMGAVLTASFQPEKLKFLASDITTIK